MKAWLARAAANTVLRGENANNRLARWSRWFPPGPTVDASRFQEEGEPYPRHWREFPRAWPPIEPADPAIRDTIASALDELPPPWRDVVIAQDIREHSTADVSAQKGVTPEQQRAMLNRARARVRERLAQRFARGDDG
jgi:RNA polymerase sigma-70 factor, ECF subfamily